MRFNSNPVKALMILLCSSFIIASCKKENGIDNENELQTPYGVYFLDHEGTLYNTSNGQDYRTIFSPDGYAIRSIVTTGENILMVKIRTFLSEDNGLNFNPTDSSCDTNIAPWQSVMLDLQDDSRVYLVSNKTNGIIYSDDKGKTWTVDNNWDTSYTNHKTPHPASLAQLANGNVFAWDNKDTALFISTAGGSPWTWVNSTTRPPTRSSFLTRFGNTLVLTDTLGSKAYYSSDNGGSWNIYPGLPATMLNAAYAPFDNTLLIGTSGEGVYRLESSIMVPSNNGLDIGTSVYGFTAKEDIYKNGTHKQYVYLVSNTGLYRSEDLGKNWIKMLEIPISGAPYTRIF